MANHLTLAVAGSGKTQGIVEHCASLPRDRRVLVVTYTQANQAEIHSRLAKYVGDHPGIEVLGWFAFLLRDFARPFIPFKFVGERVKGFNFEGVPHRMAKGRWRFLDGNGAVYKSELGRLAYELIDDSNGALLRRLECIYDEIIIDEVQDLSAYDWEIMDVLFGSSLDIRMVGDIRQSVLSTNARSSKNKKYSYASAINWFREREMREIIKIEEKSITFRCRPEIAAFSDAIFDSSWPFPATQSENAVTTGHDGVFLVQPQHVDAYVSKFRPKSLRHNVRCGNKFCLDYMNFGQAKGMQYERVLIVPTSGIVEFIQRGKHLEPWPASNFYVAVTRAAQSVAIVIDKPGNSSLPYWCP